MGYHFYDNGFESQDAFVSRDMGKTWDRVSPETSFAPNDILIAGNNMFAVPDPNKDESIIKIEDEDYKKLFSFTVLHKGWELDNEGFIAEDKSCKKVLILSSHGRFYVADKKELEEKYLEYQQVITDTLKALTSL